METGIGIATIIQQVEWIAENPRYPAGPRYNGSIRTYTGNRFSFVSDVPSFPLANNFEVRGRLRTQEGKPVLEITEVSTTAIHEDKSR